MLTFLNSKLPGDWQISDKQYTFSKKVNPRKYQILTYMLGRTWNLLFIYFTGVSNQTMKSILNVKKHLTWSKLYLVLISALELKVNQQKTIYHSVPKTFDFFFRIPLFYFINSLSTIQFQFKGMEFLEVSKKYHV